MQRGKTWKCFWLASPKSYGALKMQSNFPANKEFRKKVEWQDFYLKSDQESSTHRSRKVFLLIENCPADPEIKNLTRTNLIFLHPHTTSVLQPMDQGVIRILKTHCQKKVVRLCINAVESNKPLPKICVLQVTKHFVSSSNVVSKETITCCLK